MAVILVLGAITAGGPAVTANEPQCWGAAGNMAATAVRKECVVGPGLGVEVRGGPSSGSPWEEIDEANGDDGIATTGFLFVDDDGHRYLSTSGSCCFDKRRLGGPRAYAPDELVVTHNGRRIGWISYAVWYGVAPYDFALIRLDADVPATAAIPHFGGPTGMHTEYPDSPTLIRHVGAGMKGVPVGRMSLALTTRHRRHVTGTGAGVTLGDPGGPVTTPDGRAIGTLSNFLPEHIFQEQAAGDWVAARLAWSLSIAEETLGVRLTLQTAPLA